MPLQPSFPKVFLLPEANTLALDCEGNSGRDALLPEVSACPLHIKSFFLRIPQLWLSFRVRGPGPWSRTRPLSTIMSLCLSPSKTITITPLPNPQNHSHLHYFNGPSPVKKTSLLFSSYRWTAKAKCGTHNDMPSHSKAGVPTHFSEARS